MNFRAATALTTLAALGLAAPALAQDDRANDFDGPYISGAVGLSTRSGDGNDRIVFDTGRDAGSDNTVTTLLGANAFAPGFCNGVAAGATRDASTCRDNDDVEYAVRVGFDKRMGNFLGGLLIEGSKSDATESTTAFSSTPASYSFTRGIDYAISARGRLGITPGGGGGLFYVTGGGSYARIKHSFATTNTANSFSPNNADDMVWGIQAGGGAEVLIGNSLTLGLEYLYNRYTDDKYAVAIGTGSAGATNPFVLAGGVTARPSDKRFEFHSFRATLGFRF